ncbi:HAD-IC family P-type ATPase [Candidatus Berkiella aquae]|uniref:Calcium-transporting ATPase 1 n=1 Tax=Candidatus Berkiella aquae TaxID=295108 RepID=A0A0Q9YLE2_9GAMM|nr:cation-translocating P-type ATPase [Candidatus Berkiella aquae]MCS5711472.1 cation-translocating P-type ATPase [Candidatus Berkiella aquae]
MNNSFSHLGLSTVEAIKRLKKDGPNILPSKKRRTLFAIGLETLREPMFLLLLVAGLIYLFIGELREGLSLFVFLNLIIVIKLYQEGKTERALEALRDLASPRALVVRDGHLVHISGTDVVRDDVVLLKEGDRVPADGILYSETNLQVDESLLTGESVAVNKIASTTPMTTPMSPPGGDNLPFVYSGTLAVAGQGIFLVKATGINTEMGRIGIDLESIGTETSPLQKQTTYLVKILAAIGLLFCILLILIDGMMHGNWMKSTLLGIALLMSMIPEEFPVVLTIFPALGAWRLSSKQVLTRRISAIETLGSTSALCVDKTGTITQNSMVVSELWANNSLYNVNALDKEFTESCRLLIEYAILASQAQPFDPMEKAFHQLGKQHLSENEYLHSNWKLVHEYALTPELPAMSHIWKIDNEDHHIIAAKGSPEAIMDLCHMNTEAKQQILLVLKNMAEHGLRILAVAKGTYSGNILPKNQNDLAFTFIGLLGLSDPLREGIPQAVQECHEAGIRVIMITGDYPLTAKAIGAQAGLSSNEILTGDELKHLRDEELQNRIQSTNICARITPNQKFRIVKALKANNHIVAMTGDGVNDAPALKSAHVSIAMGNRGSDVAREASTLVLLDDNFASIVNAMRSGRRIFDNMQKSMAFILAVHVPIAGIALFPILFSLPPVFYPLHIALIELIIDPTCSIAFENEPAEKDLMKRPPRKINDPILNKKTIFSALLQGLGVLIITFLIYVLSLKVMPETEARTFTFSSLVISNLILIYSNRSRTKSIFRLLTIPNKILILIALTTIMILLSTIYLPFFADILHFSPLTINQLLLSFGGGITCVLWFEVLKIILRRI